jgi:putative Holliday junction resolvase
MIKKNRIAAIDYGRKRIGLAICDEYHITVSPVGYYFNEPETIFMTLSDKLKELSAEQIVIGMPLKFDGSEHNLKKEIEEFGSKISEISGLPVDYQDESNSSKKAAGLMIEIGTKKKKRREKGNTDMIAAAIILRDYLNEIGV